MTERMIPAHLGHARSRDYKAEKRRQLDKVIRIFRDEFAFGCAWVPGFLEICEHMVEIERIRKTTMSAKEWGR